MTYAKGSNLSLFDLDGVVDGDKIKPDYMRKSPKTMIKTVERSQE